MPIIHHTPECSCFELMGDNPDCEKHSRPQTGNRLAQLIAGVIAILIGAALIVAAIASAFGG